MTASGRAERYDLMLEREYTTKDGEAKTSLLRIGSAWKNERSFRLEVWVDVRRGDRLLILKGKQET